MLPQSLSPVEAGNKDVLSVVEVGLTFEGIQLVSALKDQNDVAVPGSLQCSVENLGLQFWSAPLRSIVTSSESTLLSSFI